MRYLLKSHLPEASWIEVSKEEWIRAERHAGFRPKLSSDHPDYMKVCATGGFGNDFVDGKIERDTQIKQADYEKISKDYRGIWEGKRTVFAGCLVKDGGTRLSVEGIDFEIIPTPKLIKRTRRHH
jgi:hypothetical protein